MNDSALLERCLSDAGYTPGVKALPELLAALASLDEERAEALERTLARVGLPAARAALEGLLETSPDARRRRLRLVGRIAVALNAQELREPLLGALEDREVRCRRIAASTLGKLGEARAEAPLLGAFENAPLDEQRVIVEALGKLGGERSLELLRALRPADAELARRREQALSLLDRRLSRSDEVRLLLDRPLGAAVTVVARCRHGLGSVMTAELASFGAREESPEAAVFPHAGTLEALFRARTPLDFALRFPLVAGSSPAERIAASLTQESVVSALQAWTDGRPRFRLAWTAGHKRSLSWEVAKLVRQKTERIVNDPSGALWEARLSPSGTGQLELAPRPDPDPRFAYRVKDVPAASHPTLAAALVRMAGVRDDDVVWDPFVGSGLELVERAKLGPYAALYGTDVDQRAIDAARANLDTAGVACASLELCDARSFDKEGVTLVISNPPMGRRVARDATLGPLLEAVLTTATRVLAKGGRIVWLSPLPARTAETARRAGLSVSEGPDVDLGGFTARVQTFEKR